MRLMDTVLRGGHLSVGEGGRGVTWEDDLTQNFSSFMHFNTPNMYFMERDKINFATRNHLQ